MLKLGRVSDEFENDLAGGSAGAGDLVDEEDAVAGMAETERAGVGVGGKGIRGSGREVRDRGSDGGCRCWWGWSVVMLLCELEFGELRLEFGNGAGASVVCGLLGGRLRGGTSGCWRGERCEPRVRKKQKTRKKISLGWDGREL